MNKNALVKVTKELESIREFCLDHNYLSYDELYEKVEVRVEALNTFASQNNVPIVISIEDLVSEFADTYEDESSSYYEEEEEEYSSYYEDEDDSSWY